MFSSKAGAVKSPTPGGTKYAMRIFRIVLVDDHILLRKGLGELIKGFDNYEILFEASNGVEFQSQLDPMNLPDLVLMDINMPIMDGHETAQWIKDNYPKIKVLTLSMFDNEKSIIKMFKAGARGYILKEAHPEELKAAINDVLTKGFYYSELVTGSLIHNINNNDEDNAVKDRNKLSERETAFLKLVCSELTYKEIAEEMCLSPRTIDGYRDALFQKLHVKTRVGLVIYAIRNRVFVVE